MHPLVPPEETEPLIRHLANTFVTDRRPNEVLAIGLNSIREVCARSPLAMEGKEALVRDLIAYRRSKDKGVLMAARSLVTLFRAVNPGLLPKKERGRGVDAQRRPLGYGEEEVRHGIEGADLLQQYGEEGGDELLSGPIPVPLGPPSQC